MIDWSAIVNRLHSSRGTLKNVSRFVGACPQSLGRLERGEVVEPRFTTGLMLLDLHLEDHPGKHAELEL